MIIPSRTVERLIIYRRVLGDFRPAYVFSHQLAALARVSPAQVRRDLMVAGIKGSPGSGYRTSYLLDNFARILDAPAGVSAVLVGVGNIGRALLEHFGGPQTQIHFVAAFDIDPAKIGRTIAGCPCWDVAQLPSRAVELGPGLGVIAVPPERAQAVADALTAVSVRAIVNFAPVLLRVRPGVHVEQVDIARAIAKAAYFGRLGQAKG